MRKNAIIAPTIKTIQLNLTLQMRVAIIETAIPGHPTFVDSAIRTLSKDNEVTLFVDSSQKDKFEKLARYINSANVVLKNFDNNYIAKTFDIQLFITPDTQKKALQLTQDAPLWLTIHNIDDWFQNNFKRQIRLVIEYLINREFKYSLYLIKDFIKNFRSRQATIKRILSEQQSYFVVLNEEIKHQLSLFVPKDKIKVLPFSVYNPLLTDLSHTLNRKRITVPGIVSQIRRDYLGLMHLIEEIGSELLQHTEFEFLGGLSVIPADKSKEIIEKAQQLNQKGFHIIYYNKPYIDIEEFDQQLRYAHYILGNLNTKVNSTSQYGKTKESGIPFTMIRANKKGILPYNYAQSLDPKLLEGSLIYHDDDGLKEILTALT